MTDAALLDCRLFVNKSLGKGYRIQMHVTKADYAYNGYLVGVIVKRSGAVRAVIEANNWRLFIHNARELELI